MAKAKTGLRNRQERPRSGRARRVAEMLPDIGGAAFRKFGFVQHAVVSRWAEIVGERYARVSAPESIRFPHGKRADGTLTIVVGAAHAPMMQHVIPEIVERVNRFFGYAAVARVALRQGLVAVEQRRTAAKPETSGPVPDALGESLKTVGDPELRAVLEAMARGLGDAGKIPLTGRIS